MYRRSRPFSGRKAKLLLGLLVLVVLSAVVVPAMVFAAGSPQGKTPNKLVSEKWAKAPAWADALADDSAALGADAEVIVQFARGTDSKAMGNVASLAGAGIDLKWARPSKAAKALPFAVYKSSTLSTAELMEQLQSQPGVVAVSPNSRLQLAPSEETEPGVPNDPDFAAQWALENTGQSGGTADADIDALTAWERTYGSSDVVVAVIDSGVDYNHPDLAGNIWMNPSEKYMPYDGVDNDGSGPGGAPYGIDDVYGIDAVNNDGDPFDDNGHGTHVSGTIAAVGDNEVGTTGVAWEAKIMALKAFDSTGGGDTDAVIECIMYAIQMKSRGVNVVAINASFETPAADEPLRNAIQAAGNAGIVFVAAAGNWDKNADLEPWYPAAYDCSNIISVGASDDTDAKGSFSNYGVTSVDLFAPGVDILSTVPASYPSDLSLPGTQLFYDNMENGSGNWTKTGTWAITDEANSTNPLPDGAVGRSWSDSPGADYAANSRTTLTSRSINLGNLACSGRWLGLALIYDLDYSDALLVKVSGNGGTSWEGLGYFSGTDEGYYWAELPDTVVTTNFKVQFVLETDGEVNADGVYIDDVQVVIPDQSAEMSGTSMAAPHVAGTIALLATAAPGDTVSARIARVLSTVDQPEGLDGLCATDGRLNAGRAVASTSPGPIIREIWPTVGSSAGGSEVEIYGNNFYGVELAGEGGVTFGGVNALSYEVKSSEYIVAVAPAGTEGTTVQVQVHAAAGSTADTGADNFTYVAPPTITGVSPASGPTLGGVYVTITGTGFEGVSSVKFGGVEAKDWWQESPGMLKAVAPAQAAGTVRVEVTAGGGPTPDGDYDSFTYVAPTVVQQNDPRLAFLGSWSEAISGYASGGSFYVGNAEGCTLTVTFEGTFLALVGKTGPDGGKAWVSVDGYEDGYADFYTEVAGYKKTVYRTDMLDEGPHTVTLTWAGYKREYSTGYAINVDAVQVLGTVTQAPLPERHQQTEFELAYTGSWANGYTWSASGGNFSYANSPGASVNVAFDGTYLSWVAKKGPIYGRAWVKLDEGQPVLVDLYSSYDKYKQKVYATGLLEDGSHTLSIYWLGQKNWAAAGYRINVDTFDVLGEVTEAPPAEPIPWTYEQNDGRITYVGPWGLRWASAASAGSFYYTNTKGAAAVVEFTGTAVELLAKKGPGYGKALVTLDGYTTKLVDFYSGSDAFKQSVPLWSGLDYRPHTLTIKNLGYKNSLSSGFTVDVDALRVSGTLDQAAKPVRAQQTDAHIEYTGGWGSAWTWLASGGSFRWANSEATVKVTFNGTYLAWVAKTGRWYGKATVKLDGVVVEGGVDLYSRYEYYKQVVYQTGLLDPGVHTLVIEWTGLKNAAAAASQINVDAFDVMGTLEDASL